MQKTFLERLKEKVIVADGAMGTAIHAAPYLDFGGAEGCNEALNLSQPRLIQDIHASFLAAGTDLIETNTFGGAALTLAEYGLSGRAFEISKKAAELAREVAAGFSSPSFPRFVAGSVGPGTRLVTLGHVNFDELYASYLPQMSGLIAGGVDLIQIETCQDPLQIKCAVIAARDAAIKAGRDVPLCVTMTVETTGTLLVGSEAGAVLAVLESLRVQMVGLNCATGPDLMRDNVRFLCANTELPVAVLPNAGLPRNVSGKAVYDLSPQKLADFAELFVREYGVRMVGGCCGTTADHIRAVVERVGSLSPAPRTSERRDMLASTFAAVPVDQEGTSPLIIGERCNANGSKQFRDLLLQENWEAIVEMAAAEAAQGSHVLDVCTAFVGRNEIADMQQVVERFSRQITAPLVVDSTQVDVLEAALKRIGGRPVINSINLEEGEEKLVRICTLARRYGAMVIALTIDEQGMAKTTERKLAVARRIYGLAVEKHGLSPGDILFDPLTFTIASGDEESRTAALQTLEAIRQIKAAIPGVRTVLGLSNVSFGLKPFARQVLNSVFLEEALAHGLDAAILHAKKILPVASITPEIVTIARDLIFDRRREGYDPLFALIERLEGAVPPDESSVEETGTVAERLKRRIIEGKKTGLESLLTEAIGEMKPLDIINTVLLEGMKVVGELFGSGKMQLPFVLQSAETMKKAVSFLEPHMDKSGQAGKGCLVLATVRGDVHDIGKNLVDIILSNNGYRVVNLGIKQPLENILAAVEEHHPDAVGMSGLLVKSTLVMKENLEEMARRQLSIPVICGGAALNRAYVEVDLREAYRTGSVFYGVDAFTGLRLMDELCGHRTEKVLTADAAVQSDRFAGVKTRRACGAPAGTTASAVKPVSAVPVPPFWGVRHIPSAQIPLRDVFTFINKKALFANQWMYRPGKIGVDAYRILIKEKVEPLFHSWCEKVLDRQWLMPSVAYGYFPCNAEGNTLLIYSPETDSLLAQITFPRQAESSHLCLADYFLPVTGGKRDLVAFHVVTMGKRPSEISESLFHGDNYSDYLHFHGLSVESTEALAEFWHKKIRHELNIAGDDGPTNEALFRQQYRGERFSFGYPACPNLEDQKIILELLEADKIGVSLTGEFQLVPEQSTSAIICHHPEAQYFSA